MVVEAANWRPGVDRARPDVLADDDHQRYLAGWMRPGDAGVVAETAAGAAVGAAWYRMLPRSAPGFGWVGTGVPELIIGVRPIWRAHGIGRLLLHELCETARRSGYARISLSVERGNFAATLYRSEGFAVTASGPGRDTMVKVLR
ncbi:GNAT family N-acetyltransferase [Microbacterium sp. NPDC091313]